MAHSIRRVLDEDCQLLEGPGTLAVAVPKRIYVEFNDIRADFPPGVAPIVRCEGRVGNYGYCLREGKLFESADDDPNQIRFSQEQMSWLKKMQPVVDRLLDRQERVDVIDEG